MKSTRSTYKFSLKIKKILIKKIHRKIIFLTLSMADFSKFKPLTLTLSLLETPLNLKTMSEMELLKILNNQSKSNSPLYKKHSTPQKSTNSLLMKIWRYTISWNLITHKSHKLPLKHSQFILTKIKLFQDPGTLKMLINLFLLPHPEHFNSLKKNKIILTKYSWNSHSPALETYPLSKPSWEDTLHKKSLNLSPINLNLPNNSSILMLLKYYPKSTSQTSKPSQY